MENSYCTVTRGQLFKDFDDSDGEGQHNYGGSFNSLLFRVDKPISLVGVSFFGPTASGRHQYDVKIDVFEPLLKHEVIPSPDLKNLRLRLHQCIAIDGNGAIFKVGFDKPLLRVNPDVWYLIYFKLQGPDTARCYQEVSMSESVTTDKGITVNFKFNEGTRQLPQIHFTI